jgi:hypothetical protein
VDKLLKILFEGIVKKWQIEHVRMHKDMKDTRSR